MNVTEAAAYLGVREKAGYELVERGEIPHRRLGKARVLMFRQRELDAWFDQLPGVAAPAAAKDGDEPALVSASFTPVCIEADCIGPSAANVRTLTVASWPGAHALRLPEER